MTYSIEMNLHGVSGLLISSVIQDVYHRCGTSRISLTRLNLE